MKIQVRLTNDKLDIGRLPYPSDEMDITAERWSDVVLCLRFGFPYRVVVKSLAGQQLAEIEAAYPDEWQEVLSFLIKRYGCLFLLDDETIDADIFSIELVNDYLD